MFRVPTTQMLLVVAMCYNKLLAALCYLKSKNALFHFFKGIASRDLRKKVFYVNQFVILDLNYILEKTHRDLCRFLFLIGVKYTGDTLVAGCHGQR
jgi:hypothetical protein